MMSTRTSSRNYLTVPGQNHGRWEQMTTLSESSLSQRSNSSEHFDIVPVSKFPSSKSLRRIMKFPKFHSRNRGNKKEDRSYYTLDYPLSGDKYVASPKSLFNRAKHRSQKRRKPQRTPSSQRNKRKHWKNEGNQRSRRSIMAFFTGNERRTKGESDNALLLGFDEPVAEWMASSGSWYDDYIVLS